MASLSLFKKKAFCIPSSDVKLIDLEAGVLFFEPFVRAVALNGGHSFCSSALCRYQGELS